MAQEHHGGRLRPVRRDGDSYLHFPMVAGIVLTAFGLKTTLSHVHEPLHLVPAAALGGGVALFLLAQVAFKHRSLSLWSLHRFVAAAVLVALIPVLHEVNALVALGLVLAVVVLLVVYESVRYAELRREERSHLHEHNGVHEPGETGPIPEAVVAAVAAGQWPSARPHAAGSHCRQSHPPAGLPPAARSASRRCTTLATICSTRRVSC